MNAFMRSSMRLLGLAVVAGMLTACEKSMNGEEPELFPDANVGAKIPDSGLRVMTRSGDGEATVCYPVQVFVFQGEACVAVQTIGSADDDVRIDLVEGTYNVCAVGGVSADDYILPTQEEATPATALTLKEGRGLTDLMAASATATLTDGGDNSVTLALRRKVMLLQSVIIRQVPTAATAVSVTITPLAERLALDGSYSGVEGSATFSLMKESDNRTWTADPDAFLFPPVEGDAAIRISITTAEGSRSYVYTTGELAANHKIDIDGTYTEAVGVTLSGSIEGVAWDEDKGITFSFDDTNDADNPNNQNSGNTGGGGDGQLFSGVPQVGETYQGCYVLDVADGDGQAEVTILAATELTGFYNADATTMESNVDAALATVTDGGVSSWRVPTRTEASLIYEAKTDIGLTQAKYLFRNSSDALKAFNVTKSSFSIATTSDATLDASTVLRPVAVVTVNKE